ncbi:MAG: hypothetical protein U0353_20645 [Sandaracinus sp.]
MMGPTPLTWARVAWAAVALAVQVVAADFLLGAGLARAQARTLTASQTIPISIASSEFPMSGSLYLANLDQRRRIVGNAWIRRATLNGPIDTTLRISADACRETSTFIPGYPCTSVTAAERDRVEFMWFAGTPVTAFNDDLNRQTGRVSLAVPSSGANSLLFPGMILRFVSGPEVPHIPPWMPRPLPLPVGEDTGWRLNSITVHPSSPAAQGSTLPPTITPYERFSGVLLGGTSSTNDEVYVVLPTSSRPQSLAVWFDETVPTGTTAFVMVRCGMRPSVSNFFDAETIGKTAPWLFVLPACSSGWHAVVRYTGATSVSFHMRAGEHYPDKHRTYVSVGFQNATANQAERDRGRLLVRQAAWRFYGMTGGTHIVTGFDWRPDCSNDIDRVTICIKNRPATDGCTENTGHASWPGAVGGRMQICTDTRGPAPEPGWTRSRSAVLAHEMVHAFVEHGDEYWVSNWPSLICGQGGVTILRCLHSTMSISWHGGQVNTLCTDATHNIVTQYLEQDGLGPGSGVVGLALVRGPNTLTECLNGDIVSNGPAENSCWQDMWGDGRIPYPHPAYTPDNYSFELFGNTPDIVVLGGHSN